MRELYPTPDPPAVPPSTASWVREDDGVHDQTLEENWLFRLRRERFRSRTSGLVHNYYVMHLADAVNVIALTPDRQLVLVRQFRAGSGRDSLETPGGLLDADEDPLTAGARELLEETGYAGDAPELLGTVWSNPSIMTSRTTIIVIANAQKVAPTKLDHGEEVTVELVPEHAVPLLIREGRIDHALVVCGLLWWLQARFPGLLATAQAVPTGQYTIAKVMTVITAVALVLGLWRNIGNGWALGILALICAGVVLMTWVPVWRAVSGR